MFSVKTDVSPPWNFSFSSAVTLKIRSRLPKSNHFFVMSQLYIHENLVRTQQLVNKVLCRQESVMLMLTPTGAAPKTICPPPSMEGGTWLNKYNKYNVYFDEGIVYKRKNGNDQKHLRKQYKKTGQENLSQQFYKLTLKALPRSDVIECSIWSWSTLFVLNICISIIHDKSKN